MADMPEQMMIAISNSWEPRFGSGINEIAGALDIGTRVAGENIMVQPFSQLMWMNTTPIELPLTMMFDAEDDAYSDVFKPMNALELLALPDVQGSLLTAPGPSVANPNRNKISIFVGRMYHFPSVVLTSISSQYDTQRLDASGYPLAGQVDITFSTDKVYGKSDWNGISLRPGGGR